MKTLALKTSLAFAILFAVGFSAPQFSNQTLAAAFVQETDDKTELSEAQKLEADQKRLAEQYKLLEEKLFSLHEFEKDSNPIRSKLLQRAFVQSQEKMTSSQMKMIVKLLTKSKLKDAEGEQKEVLGQLEALLELLQSEDRGKRVRDEIQRHQAYLKEVERILRIQKGIRGQTEGGVDERRLSNSQEKVAERTGKLGNEIGENESGESESGGEPNSESNSGGKKKEPNEGSDKKDPNEKPSGTKEGQSKDGEAKDGEPKDGEPNDGEPNDGEPKDGDSKNGQAKGDEEKSGDAESKPADGQPSEGQPGEGQSGEGQSGEPSEQAQPENPTRKRIQAAEDRMRKAQEKLDKAQRDDAIEEMIKAEREMAAAKKELEEILRQLREEEIERTLAMLEGRFRKMLEREIRLIESTKKLNEIVPEQRATDFEIRAGKLSVEQSAIATDAARALLLLREDGSSVAFPATVDEMHQDMQQVANRLSAAKVGRITIEIEEDIVDTLNYLIAALVQTQEDMEKMKQRSKSGKGGQPGDRPLVDKLAEIKMLRGLQERIMRRHKRYARFLDDPDDMVGETDDPEVQAALNRLAEKQAQLTEIARDIVNEKNK